MRILSEDGIEISCSNCGKKNDSLYFVVDTIHNHLNIENRMHGFILYCEQCRFDSAEHELTSK